MKKVFFILFFIAITAVAAFAQPQNGALRVSLSDNSIITVAVDGRYFHKYGPSITVTDLPPGRHYMKIYAYVDDRRGGYADPLFEGRIRVADGAMTVFVLDAATGVPNITTEPADGYNATAGGSGRIENGNAGDNKYPPSNNSSAAPEPDQNMVPAQPDNAPANPNQNYASPANTISQQQLDKLKVKVQAKITDTERMKVMQNGLKNESLATAQVQQLMTWLNFESSRVEFAKWAYSITADPQNYEQLERQFAYKNSQEELESFINGNK